MPSARAAAEPSRQAGAACDCAQAPYARPWLTRMPEAARYPLDAAITIRPGPLARAPAGAGAAETTTGPASLTRQ